MTRETAIQIIKWGALIGALAFTFVFVVAGFGNPMDSFYWMGLYEEGETSSIMTCGTIALGHLWGKIFGYTVFSMRFLGWMLSVTAVSLPYLILLDPPKRHKNIHWLAITYCLLGYGVFQEFSPGTLTVFLISLLIVFWKKYTTNRNYLFVLPVIIAFAVATRFPNVLVLPLLLLLLILFGSTLKWGTKRVVVDSLLLTCCSLVLCLLFYYLLGDNFSVGKLLSEISGNASGGHSIFSMMVTLLIKGLLLFIDAAIVFVIGYCIWKIHRIKNNFIQWGTAILLAIVVFFSLKYCIFIYEWYNTHLHYFISSISVSMALYFCFLFVKCKEWEQFLTLVSFLALGAVVPLGSDTAWLKLFPMYLALLPYVAAQHSFSALIGVQIYPTILSVCLFSMLTYCFNSIGNTSLFQSKTVGSIPLYSHIFIPQYTDDYMVELSEAYNKYGNENNTISVGNGGHLFRQITHCNRAYDTFWLNINDSVFVEKMEGIVTKQYPTVFNVYIPDFDYPEDGFGNSRFDIMLKEQDYNEVGCKDGYYVVYRPEK